MSERQPFDPTALPPPWPEPLLESIRAKNEPSPLVILDDDPLGGQCIHDVPVLTSWNRHDLAEEMDHSKAFLLLTDTRALSRKDATERARDIGFALQQAALEAAVMPTLVWRSDSTLRGHFWHELTALAQEFEMDGMEPPVYVLIPYFGEAGRVTLDDRQYIVQDGSLVPVHETEFAADPAFAYSSSHLPTWLETHTEGKIRAANVMSINLQDLRTGGPDRVAAILTAARPPEAVIVNALDGRDLEVFVAGLQQAEEAGRHMLCTGAAPFIRARLGQEQTPLLTANDLDLQGTTGGLTIVGSYVDKTTEQLRHALVSTDVNAIEVRPGSDGFEQVLPAVTRLLANGQDVVLHTSRTHTPEAGSLFSEALAGIVESLDVRPRYLLVKGGSTAGRLATGVLGVRRAMVLGQLQAGVPAWRLGDESRWPDLPFVIFAGNVGTEESLTQALRTLRGS